MKSSSAEKAVILFSMFVLFSFGGCYTVLMDPSMLTSLGNENSLMTSTRSGETSDAVDTQNYISRDAQADLDNGYSDAQSANLNTSPMVSVDYGWEAPAASLPWWDQAVAPVPPTAVTASSSSAAGSGPHQRTTGSTRSNVQSSPDIQATTTVTTTTTITTAPPPPAATAATVSSATTDRSRTTGNNSAAPAPATRKTGSNRGDGRD